MGLVMQEPTLFNYTITENILYGKEFASNQEVHQAADIANSLEFIESEELQNSYEDSAEALAQAFEDRKSELTEKLGLKEYEDKLKSL